MERVDYHNIVSKNIETIDEGNQPSFSFSPALLRNESRLLECGAWTCPEHILSLTSPGVMAQAIK
jgi:hypothetical protein